MEGVEGPGDGRLETGVPFTVAVEASWVMFRVDRVLRFWGFIGF